VKKRVYVEPGLDMGDFEVRLQAVLAEVLESITSLQTLPEAPLQKVSPPA
jgi:anionic cell wall polymer biosynthesis LytR-Cps2A-Psr (LCP) family protein